MIRRGAMAALALTVVSLIPSGRTPLRAGIVTREQVEISAPILPSTNAIYAPFPGTLAGEQAMAHQASLTFAWLLEQCAPLYPKISVAAPGDAPLTAEQLAVNYDEVGRCSYEKYAAKPYWIPQLVDDVDICGTELGNGWRLITEDDLASLTERDFQFVKDALTTAGTLVAGDFFGSFYFGTTVWLRAHDGTLQTGTLEPGVAGSRVAPLHVARGDVGYRDHYEGGLALRCIRRTDLPDQP
jgi:hypothetical protein